MLLFLLWTLLLSCTGLGIVLSLIGIIDYFYVIRPLQQKALLYENNRDVNVHKVGFSSEKARSMGKMDAVVIGSGLGGLTAAALLARRGYKVIVLEQHDVAGGCTHTFKMNSSNSRVLNLAMDMEDPTGRKPEWDCDDDEKTVKSSSRTNKSAKSALTGYEFDVGLHYVGSEVGDRFSPFGYLFSTISQNQLIWNELDSDFDSACISRILAAQRQKTSVSDGNKGATEQGQQSQDHQRHIFSVGSDEAYTRQLLQRFPEANLLEISRLNNICRWVELFMPVYCMLKVFPMWLSNAISTLSNMILIPALSTSTRDMIASCTSDEDLIGVISYCYGDYGVPPKRSAFLMHAMLAVHFRQGAYYPVGGSSEIAKTVIPTILAAGGHVFVRAPVSKIMLSEDRSRVIGVNVRGVDIHAPVVISAAGVMTTFNKLLCADMLDTDTGTAGSTTTSSSPVDMYVQKVRKLLLARPYYPQTPYTVAANSTADIASSTAMRTKDAEKSFAHKLEPSCPMFTLFVGINRNCSDLGATSQNHWVFPHWRHDDAVGSFYDSLSPPDSSSSADSIDPYLPVTFISCASAKDPTWTERHGPNSAVFECLTMADYDSFLRLQKQEKGIDSGSEHAVGSVGSDVGKENDSNEGKGGRTENKSKVRRVLPGNRGQAYESEKRVLERKLLQVLYETYPQLHEAVKAEAEGRAPALNAGQEPLQLQIASGTPLTNNFYIGSNAGEIYGLAHTTTRFNGSYEWLLRPRQESVPGLFLSGQDVCTAGIAGATAGGFLCALSIIGPLLIMDLCVNYVINLFLYPFGKAKNKPS